MTASRSSPYPCHLHTQVESARVVLALRYRKWQNGLQMTVKPYFCTEERPRVSKQSAK